MKKTLSKLLGKTTSSVRIALGFKASKNVNSRQQKKLSEAIVCHDYRKIKKMLAKGISLSHLKSLYGTVIHGIYRLTDGDIKSLNFFLDRGVDYTARDSSHKTILDTLIADDRLDVLKALIQRQPFAVLDSSEFMTVAQAAIYNQQEELIKCIIEFSAERDDFDEIVADMLFETVLQDNLTLARLILKNKFNRKRTWQNGGSLLHFVKSTEMLALMVKQGLNVNHKDECGLSVISKLVVENQEPLVLAMLKLEPELSDDVAGIYELVITAAKNNSIHVIEALLRFERGQNTNKVVSEKRNNFCREVLCQVIEDRCSLDVIKFLVNYGAEINGRNFYNQTPLMIACIKNNPYYIRYLTALNVNVNLVDDFGRSALLYAIINRSNKCIKVLLANNVDIKLADNKGFDVAMHCFVSGNKFIADLLIQKNIVLLKKYDDKKTSLIFAAMAGNTDMVTYLIEAGADYDMADKKKRTALMYAAANNHLDSVRILIEANANISLKDKNGHTAADMAKTNEVANLFMCVFPRSVPVTKNRESLIESPSSL
ncbi:hypothetical protein MNBD_GAMMA12-3383 [hydrothermal vent metagenome]|uniref:Uncharacterized protein n=1 Tax=hydrothermal vent metagenome TaxID=652676 RepID=A0A3B0YF34_9ZZZZ